jgi:single-strand DNA-binding protein
MATDETFKDRNGERQKRTEWHRIVLWGKLAEIGQQYLKKGHLVYIEGRIQSRQWDDPKTNTKRTSFDIVGNVMRMLTSRAESVAAGARASGGASYGASSGGGGGFDAEGPAPPHDEPVGGEVTDEDIPF